MEYEHLPYKEIPHPLHHANERRATQGSHGTSEEVGDKCGGSYKNDDRINYMKEELTFWLMVLLLTFACVAIIGEVSGMTNRLIYSI